LVEGREVGGSRAASATGLSVSGMGGGGGGGLKGVTVDGLEEEALMLFQAERARARLRPPPLSRGFSHAAPLPDTRILSEILSRSLDPFVIQDVFLPKTHYGTSRAARVAARAARPPRTVGEAIAMRIDPLGNATPEPQALLDAAKDGIEEVQRGGGTVQWHPVAKLNAEMKELTRGAFATSGPLSRPSTRSVASAASAGAASTSQPWIPGGSPSPLSASRSPDRRRRRPSTVGSQSSWLNSARGASGGWDVASRPTPRSEQGTTPRAARTARDFTPDEFFEDANRLIDIERDREADVAEAEALAKAERRRKKEAAKKERLMRELADFNSARNAMIEAKREEAAAAKEAEKRRQRVLARELKMRGEEQVRQYKEKRDVLLSNALIVKSSTRSHFGRANFEEINATRGPIARTGSTRAASAK